MIKIYVWQYDSWFKHHNSTIVSNSKKMCEMIAKTIENRKLKIYTVKPALGLVNTCV